MRKPWKPQSGGRGTWADLLRQLANESDDFVTTVVEVEQPCVDLSHQGWEFPDEIHNRIQKLIARRRIR